VKLGELPNSKEEAENQPLKDSLDGVSVESLDVYTAKELRLPAFTPGVVIMGIDPSSPQGGFWFAQR
jgi:hypothetical protein